MVHIKKVNEMLGGKNNITIDLQVDDWYLAESLHDIAERIENDDILDGLYDEKNTKKEVAVNGEHFAAVIRKN